MEKEKPTEVQPKVNSLNLEEFKEGYYGAPLISVIFHYNDGTTKRLTGNLFIEAFYANI